MNDAYALEWSSADYPRNLYADRWLRYAYYLFQRTLEKTTYRKFRSLMANSRHVADQIISGYGLNRRLVHTAYYGLQAPGPVNTVKLDGSPAILFIGGNFQRKGLPLLIQAVAAAEADFPGIRLHVVGRDRNQPALAEIAAQLGVRDRVTFHGWKPNDVVRGMLAGADIFALPSLTEGFGFVYLEAMQLGTPVIATAVGGASEVFRREPGGCFVNPKKVGELGDAIARIASNKAFADALRKGGRLAASRFTPLAMATAGRWPVWTSLRRSAPERTLMRGILPRPIGGKTENAVIT